MSRGRAVQLLWLAAVFALGAAIVWAHLRLSSRGLCFTEPTWSFHFGHRVVDGEVPYRDFIYPHGPLPLYVEALFQSVLGSTYGASLVAALFVKTARVLVVALLVRRLVGVPAAFAAAACCGLSPVFGGLSHDGSSYVELFLLLAAFFAIRAGRRSDEASAAPRSAGLHLAAVGGMTALATTVMPGAALLLLGMLTIALAILVVRKDVSARGFAATLGGAAGALVLVGIVLALVGDLGAMVTQTLLAAGERREVHGAVAILDALLGGTLTDPALPGSFVLTFLLLPCILVAASLYLASRPDSEQISVQSLALLLVPLGMILTLSTRHLVIEYFADLPRTFLTVLLALAVALPRRLRSWFGLAPLLVVVLGGLPLAGDWTIGIELRGRHGGDLPALVLGVLLLACASTRITASAKSWLCAVLAFGALAHLVAEQRAWQPRYGEPRFVDGTRGDNQTRPSHPMLAGLRVSRARSDAVDWLTSHIPPGSTCFIHGDLAVLYTLTGCDNPTQLDSVSQRFASRDDANRAVAMLRGAPPQYLLVQGVLPPLDAPPTGASSPTDILHAGLHAILGQFEPVGGVADVLMPSSAAQLSCDGLMTLQLFRRKEVE